MLAFRYLAAAVALSAVTINAAPSSTIPVLVIGGLTAPGVVYTGIVNQLIRDGFPAAVHQLLPGPGVSSLTPGCADFDTQAAALQKSVDALKTKYSVSKVHVVGHSLGGVTALYWLKKTKNASTQIAQFISLASPYHASLFVPTLPDCTSTAQLNNATFRNTFLKPTETAPGPIRFTTIGTKFDQIIIPATSGFLAQDSTVSVTNKFIQDYCPLRTPEHLFLLNDGATYQLFLSALRNENPIKTNCAAVNVVI